MTEENSNSIIVDESFSTVFRHRYTVSGTHYIEERNAEHFFSELSNRTCFDTGLMPSGVLSVKQYGEYLQIAVVAPPSKNLVIWGKSEGQTTAETFLLAQPYRVMIGEFREGAFLGARMFYSPVPITSQDDLLYHANVPNLNCQGYRGTGVGWVCLYHSHDTTQMTIGEKAAYVGLRCSGNEAYNDDNMVETDGPRFYEQNNYPSYTYNPHLWDLKTQEEGIEWTLNSANWIPVLVQSQSNQEAHYYGGEHLTLGMALEGPASYYYHDDKSRLWQRDASSERIYEEVFNRSFSLSKHIDLKEINTPKKLKPFELPHGLSFVTSESSDTDDTLTPENSGDSNLDNINVPLNFIAAASWADDKSAILHTATFALDGFNYTVIDRVELGLSSAIPVQSMQIKEIDKNACLVTSVYRNGQLVGHYEPTLVRDKGSSNEVANLVIKDIVRASVVAECMEWNAEAAWHNPPADVSNYESVLQNLVSNIPENVIFRAYALTNETSDLKSHLEMLIEKYESDNHEDEEL